LSGFSERRAKGGCLAQAAFRLSRVFRGSGFETGRTEVLRGWVEAHKKLQGSWFEHRHLVVVTREGSDRVNRVEPAQDDKGDLVAICVLQYLAASKPTDFSHRREELAK